MVGALLDELRRERHEDEPREHDVRRGRIPRTGEELRRVLGGNGELEARALAEDGEREALADELARDDDAEVERRGTLLASHAPVVGDRHAIDRREDVADAEHGVEVADLGDVLHEDARGRRREEDEAPQRLILERLKGRRKSGKAAEWRRRRGAGAGKRRARRGGGTKVLEHAPEDAHWHNLAHVLSIIRPLEGDADDVAVAHRRPAAVPGVDGRVDRHDEVILAALQVRGPIYARDDATRDRDAVAADGEADDVDVLLEARRMAERQLDCVEPEGVARDSHDREVGLVRDGEDLRHVLVKVAILAHLQRRGEFDDVRVRNDEPTAR